MPDELPIILLAEDKETDSALMCEAFRTAEVLNPIRVVRDGVEAIEYLKGVGKYANRAEYPLPILLLLDLDMPRLDGFQVLQWIRQTPALSALRVVVLTSANQTEVVNRAYQLGANSFLMKPIQFEHLVDSVKAIDAHWLWGSLAPKVQSTPSEESQK